MRMAMITRSRKIMARIPKEFGEVSYWCSKINDCNLVAYLPATQSQPDCMPFAVYPDRPAVGVVFPVELADESPALLRRSLRLDELKGVNVL